MTRDASSPSLEGHVISQRNAFAVPRGFTGRLAGRYMGRTTAQHEEIVPLVEIAPGSDVLEVGYGPGQMIGILAGRFPSSLIIGADPSEDMLRMAARRNRDLIDAARVQLRIGAAGAIPCADSSCGAVVSVNNVRIWPDLDIALAEIARVLAPSGQLVVAWHGQRSPRRIQRKLSFGDDDLARVERSLRAHFTGVRTHPLRYSDAWTARRA
jgi:ubiquinone/menaquinone biosynthesis C-methylase UbiE